MLNNIDDDGNGRIEYHEFLAHAIGKKQLSRSNLSCFFSMIISQDQILKRECQTDDISSSSLGSQNEDTNDNAQFFDVESL